MTFISVNDTAACLSKMVERYVDDLKKLPSSSRLSETSQATVYAMACSLLQVGKLQQASSYFSFLLLYAPTHPDYLRAKASCAMQSGDPHQAADLLSLALHVEPESCAIALELAEALISLGAATAAQQILLLVRKLANLPSDTTEHARAGLLLQTLTPQQAVYAPA